MRHRKQKHRDARRRHNLLRANRSDSLIGLISRFDTVYKAYQETKKGKMHRQQSVIFVLDGLKNVYELSQELKTGKYRMPDYSEFTIYEPKERTIHSIPFKDKIVQKIVCQQILQPFLEPLMIDTSFACRKGKGTHKGLEETKEQIRKAYRLYGENFYILKCDVKKYFDSINHNVMIDQISEVIEEKEITDLIEMFIRSMPKKDGRGLPLGNESSQWLSIYHLNGLDHFVKRRLKIKAYIRYMDDFVLIHPDKNKLREARREIEEYLSRLGLELNEKSHIFPIKNGVDFLGFRLYVTPTGKIIQRLRRQSSKDMKRKLKQWRYDYKRGKIDKESITQSFESWKGHARHGNNFNLIQHLTKLYDSIFEGDELNGFND